MAKNIVLLSDGTGNTAIKGRGTNVFKLFEALDLNGHRTNPKLTPQIAFYDDGVGTQSLRPLKVIAGATGLGLGRNVRQLYKELCRVYDPGDRIFLFGFSRGAFTVRSLAGLIGLVGIVDPRARDGRGSLHFDTAAKFKRAVREAYRVYKWCYPPTVLRRVFRRKDDTRAARFRSTYCLRADVRIAFIGVWDTVDAVGLPFGLGYAVNEFYRFKFPDFELGSYVDRAVHALAIDDQRAAFHPLLWDERNEKARRIEQVWFAGAHSNVGGGYPKQGMSIVALDWMMSKAAEDGLRFNGVDREYSRAHAQVDDQLYDPRARLGIFYRWKPRDIGRVSAQNGIPRPHVHLSVFERAVRGTDDYAPGNLPSDAIVVTTPTGDPEKEKAACVRARAVEAAFHAIHPSTTSLLAAEKSTYALGVASFQIFLSSWLGLLGVLLWPEEIPVAGSLATLPSFDTFVRTAQRIWSLVSDPVEVGGGLVGTAFERFPGFMILLLVGFSVTFVLSSMVDNRLSAAFSRFWHAAQQDIRHAMKDVREEALALKVPLEPARPLPASGDGRSTPSPNGPSLQPPPPHMR